MHDRHAHTVGGRSPKPAPIFPSRPCSLMEKPVNDPQEKRHARAAAGSIAWLRKTCTLLRVIAAIAPFAYEVAGSPILESSARRVLKR